VTGDSERAFVEAIGPEVMQGMHLTSDQARALESRLEHSEDPLADRLRLIGFYSLAALSSPGAEARLEGFARWIVEQAPSSAAAGSMHVALHAGEGAAALWDEQLARHPSDAQVFANAARYFQHLDPARAFGLLSRARSLAPDREWTFLPEAPQRACHADAGEAEDPAYSRWLALGDAALEALGAGDLTRAEQLARELLETADTYEQDWNHDNAVHQGRTILGQLALRRGDLELARRLLLASAELTGSPQLKSFGPTMRLAKELLEAGERAAPLEYFERCRAFWAMGHSSLDLWRDEVLAGRSPDFFFNAR
jgi:hypothetical protein